MARICAAIANWAGKTASRPIGVDEMMPKFAAEPPPPTQHALSVKINAVFSQLKARMESK